MSPAIDKGSHLALGDKRADGDQHGEAAWTLLSDNMWIGSPYRVTKLERLPRPGWLK